MSKILFELGFEEMPVSELIMLNRFFPRQLSTYLENKNIECDKKFYSTPRRVAFIFDNVPLFTEHITAEFKGPPVHVFFDKNGEISKQGKGFLKSKNIPEKDIESKNNFIYYKADKGGESIVEILKGFIDETVKSIPFKKTMKWPNSNIRFSRPIRWMMLVIDNEVETFSLAGIDSGNITYGNRNAGNREIIISDIDDYRKLLSENFVILDDITETSNKYRERSISIQNQLTEICSAINVRIDDDEELIMENAMLTEYPVVLMGTFAERFLNIPDSIIKAALKQHQKYMYASGTNHFAFVSNQPESEYKDAIIHNNEKIITARLEDAEFYFKADMKRSLKEYSENLNSIVFFRDLGTYGDKIKRISAIASEINNKTLKRDIDFNKLSLLCKFDIATDMIKDGKEFTKLQGEIGYQYALKMGIDKLSASVSFEHYLPRTKNDSLPTVYESMLFSIADKIDNITGAFIAGHKPTGNKDVMGVRRDALALIYLLNKLRNYDKHDLNTLSHINIIELLDVSLSLYSETENAIDEIAKFVRDRLENYMTDLHYNIDIIRAVLNCNDIILPHIFTKAELLSEYKFDPSNDDFRTMITGIKRVCNILRSAEYSIKNTIITENQYEKALYENAKAVNDVNSDAFREMRFRDMLENILKMRPVIDAFFDNVMVMDEDAVKRNNRLTLLHYVKTVFDSFCDFSQIVMEGTNNIDTQKD